MDDPAKVIAELLVTVQSAHRLITSGRVWEGARLLEDLPGVDPTLTKAYEEAIQNGDVPA